MFEALRAAAVVVVGPRSRRMLGRLEVEAMLSLGWSSVKCAMARSDAMTGGAAVAFASHAGAAVLRVAGEASGPCWLYCDILFISWYGSGYGACPGCACGYPG